MSGRKVLADIERSLFEASESNDADLKAVSGKLYGALAGLKEALAAAQGTQFKGEISSLMTKVQAVKAKVDDAENKSWASSHKKESLDEEFDAKNALKAGDEVEKGLRLALVAIEKVDKVTDHLYHARTAVDHLKRENVKGARPADDLLHDLLGTWGDAHRAFKSSVAKIKKAKSYIAEIRKGD